ncbi:[Fe-Fe] hydrogenase large subunit C-terminal domain-containing protein [Desulfothermobacter acidiphilus]|uniref:[Fe-Fe] hydrogenase large subunit C-terminal domain-containing protein n=1 Tax=Desulfothermobacter acidiphilus TaxID=1938353 RepID=UPI003F8B5002
MDTIKLTIDGREVTVPAGTTILKAAQQVGIEIPTLCYLEGVNEVGACRMCVVEIEGEAEPKSACITPVREGMVVFTDTPAVQRIREATMQRIRIARAHRFATRELMVDSSVSAIERDPSKCIACLRCESVCHRIQTVGAVALQEVAGRLVVAPVGGRSLVETGCVQCGQCTHVCLTGAIRERGEEEKASAILADKSRYVVAQVAPACRVSLGEIFFAPPGEDLTGKMVAALRRLGFRAVFDTTLGADLTVVEEAKEFQRRLAGDGPLPLFTSCCPAWVSFLGEFYPQLVDHLSTCKSPHQMLGTLCKTYYAAKKRLNPRSVAVISIMPCTAKKAEALRVLSDVRQDVDLVLTMRELGRLLKGKGIDPGNLPGEEFDLPFGAGSGSGQLFGFSGGVATSLLRTLLAWEKNSFWSGVWHPWREEEHILQTAVTIRGRTLGVLRVQTLGKARLIAEKLQTGELQGYHLVEVMACPGGCVGGGGQPIPTTYERVKARAAGLELRDARLEVRMAHENPLVQQLYREFLREPGGEKARELLHVRHFPEAQAPQRKKRFSLFGR